MKVSNICELQTLIVRVSACLSAVSKGDTQHFTITLGAITKRIELF